MIPQSTSGPVRFRTICPARSTDQRSLPPASSEACPRWACFDTAFTATTAAGCQKLLAIPSPLTTRRFPNATVSIRLSMANLMEELARRATGGPPPVRVILALWATAQAWSASAATGNKSIRHAAWASTPHGGIG